MLVSSQYVSSLLGDDPMESDNSTLALFNETEVVNSTLSTQDDSGDLFVPDVGALTAMFFIFYFLAATQDVVVDGWALTMLKPSNVGYASTCNSVGQQTGWVLGFVVFTSLGKLNKTIHSGFSKQNFYRICWYCNSWHIHAFLGNSFLDNYNWNCHFHEGEE